MSELKFRKLHIDSRLRSSGTNSEFDYSLGETFATPENCVCWVDAVVLPHSWSSIDDSNKYLYVAERSGPSTSYTYSVRRVELATGSHSGPSLKGPIQTAFNSNTPASLIVSSTVVPTPTKFLSFAMIDDCGTSIGTPIFG